MIPERGANPEVLEAANHCVSQIGQLSQAFRKIRDFSDPLSAEWRQLIPAGDQSNEGPCFWTIRGGSEESARALFENLASRGANILNPADVSSIC